MQKLGTRQIGPHCILACLYFLLLPTTIAVNSTGNSILKLATIPIGIFFLISLLLSDRKLQINSVHLTLLLYTISVIATLFCDAGSAAKDAVFGYVLNAAIYLCMTVVPYNKEELELMETVQIILLVILNAITLLSGGTEDGRTTLMILGQTSDPNYFVGFFIFPVTVALKRAVSGKWRIFCMALIAVSMYSVFLSGSRGGMLALVATVVGFALIYPTGLRGRFLFLIGGPVILLVLWLVLKPVLPESVVERMSIASVVETGGTGRMDIWSSMLKEIVEQPDRLLFGRGINALHGIFLNGEWGRVVAHNQLLQLLYNQGLVGMCAFLALVGVAFFRCCKKRKTVAIALVGMMALSLSLSFNQTVRTFWNLIAYAAFAFPDEVNTIDNGGLSDHECS